MSFSNRAIPIIELVHMGQVDTAKKLIEAKKCDVNEKDEFGRCAVIAAANREDDTEMMEVLINAGANLDVKDDFGNTPLSLAKKNGYDKLTKLIEATLANQSNSKPQMR